MFKTIKKIAKHVSCVQEAMLHVVDELRQRAFVHDSSKFEKDELKGYVLRICQKVWLLINTKQQF